METITLKYTDVVTQYSRVLTAMSVYGFIPTEAGVLDPDILNRYLSGTYERQMQGFNRRFTIEFGPARMVDLDWLFIGNFLVKHQNNIQVQLVSYSYSFNSATVTESDLAVTLEEGDFFAEFLDAYKNARKFTLRLIEKNSRTGWPSGSTADATSTVYIKRKVEITGTKASPQTLTTNTAPLATDQAGNAFPTFTDINKIQVEFQQYQEAAIIKTTEESLTGNNLTFAVARSDIGDAFPADGKYYADVVIKLKG